MQKSETWTVFKTACQRSDASGAFRGVPSMRRDLLMIKHGHTPYSKHLE